MPSPQSVLERNLLALSTRDPVLCMRIGRTDKSDRLGIQQSRSGKPVPFIAVEGRKVFLHSQIDPDREGERLLSIYQRSGYLVFLGLGGAYHILPFLRSPDVNRILIIEKDLSLFKSVIASIDLYHLILDRRVEFLIDPGMEELRECLLSTYVPALTGDLKTIPLRPRMDIDLEYFSEVTDWIRTTIGLLSDDYTVQVHFGKKWFKNTAANLEAAQETTTILPPIRKALITAAGPSLEEQIPTLIRMRKDATLIATDTSYAALMKMGIRPDIVISIDCQHITYHHFLSGFPDDIPLVLDLASPPLLAKIARRHLFFSSGHPFSRYASRNWRRFPFIDTSGGNVCHAAVSLADLLGAETTYLFGADFSYPRGKSYARGTYLYPYFSGLSGRISPLSSHFFSFLMRNANIVKERREYGFIYTTRPMISYKERLEQSASSLDTHVQAIPGSGVPLSFPAKGVGRGGTLLFGCSAGPASSSWEAFLGSYIERLMTLPPPFEPFVKYMSTIPDAQQDLWKTLYPVAAAIRKEFSDAGIKSRSIMEEARDWPIAMAEHYLSLAQSH